MGTGREAEELFDSTTVRQFDCTMVRQCDGTRESGQSDRTAEIRGRWPMIRDGRGGQTYRCGFRQLAKTRLGIRWKWLRFSVTSWRPWTRDEG